jgi:uncharacterized protein
LTFWIRVKPRSAHERLELDAAGGFKLSIQAPPVAGAANEASIRFLARALRLPQASIEIVSGANSRRKLLRVTGRPAEETLAKLQALAAEETLGRRA